MLKKILTRSFTGPLWIFCDGSSGAVVRTDSAATELAPLGVKASAAAIARREDGTIVDWAWNDLPNLTNNEAEYAGLLLGVELARGLQPSEAIFVLDSDVVVGQMQGRFAVNSASLRPWHQRACAAVRHLPAVRYYAVPRSWNRLADGLAGQAGIPWRALMRAIEQREVVHAQIQTG